MANKYRERFVGTVTPVAGERTRADLQNGARNYWLYCHARARIEIAVAAVTSIRNRGSVWALFRKHGVEEDGKDRHVYDGPMSRFISEVHAPSALTATRLTSTAIGITFLEEGAWIYFTHGLSAAPNEQVYREINASRRLQYFVEQVVNSINALVVPGGATVTVDTISIEVYQIMDLSSTDLPLVIPVAREIVRDVPSANPNLRVEFNLSNFVRLIALKQEVVAAASPAQVEVADIINGVALRGDVLDIIGPQASRWDATTFMQEGEFGGLVTSTQAYRAFNFQRGGKLSNVLNPGDDINLRFELDVQPSVAVAGSSRVRVQLMELERTLPGVLTAAQLPFAM